MTSRSPSVLITQAALDDMIHAGQRALPNETGGILAGFRAGLQIIVTRMAVVPDRASTHVSFQLRRRKANQQLNRLREASATAVVGYVGDWHTHPTLAPPSALDHHSLAEIAATSEDLVALVVVPFDVGQPLIPQVLVARSARRGRAGGGRVDLSIAQLIVSNTVPHDLEVRANAACQLKE